MGVQGLIKQSNVKVICTTDDPADDLKWHQKLKEEQTCSAKVYPAMRPDKLLNIDKAGYAEYMARLGEAAGVEIKTFADIRTAMDKRIAFFEDMAAALRTTPSNTYFAARPAKTKSTPSWPRHSAAKR